MQNPILIQNIVKRIAKSGKSTHVSGASLLTEIEQIFKFGLLSRFTLAAIHVHGSEVWSYIWVGVLRMKSIPRGRDCKRAVMDWCKRKVASSVKRLHRTERHGHGGLYSTGHKIGLLPGMNTWGMACVVPKGTVTKVRHEICKMGLKALEAKYELLFQRIQAKKKRIKDFEDNNAANEVYLRLSGSTLKPAYTIHRQ